MLDLEPAGLLQTPQRLPPNKTAQPTGKHRRRLLFIFGTRPEAIKLAPVIAQARAAADTEVVVCVTGQHRQMLDQVLHTFDIVPDIDLGVMRDGQPLSALTARVLCAVGETLDQVQPDCVVVHGDTTSTFAATLAAYYARTPVAHVEAGLRTGDLYSPWPEELNRRLPGLVAQLHLAPTEQARQNLRKEGVDDRTIHVTGNTVIDALRLASARLDTDQPLRERIAHAHDWLDPSRRLILVTGHRRENFGDGFNGICQALQILARRDDVQIVYPVHLNPNVREPVTRMLGHITNVHLIEPQDYLPFVDLLRRCSLVLTDSGGLQEEAPGLGKPVLVLRDTTERPEAIMAGTARLVGTDPERVVAATSTLLDDEAAYCDMARAVNPFGDGHAAARIVTLLRTTQFTNTTRP